YRFFYVFRAVKNWHDDIDYCHVFTSIIKKIILKIYVYGKTSGVPIGSAGETGNLNFGIIVLNRYILSVTHRAFPHLPERTLIKSAA
ncbi:hypothetical protein, partial [Acetobacter sp.]|uniref:hypothetical protein n=1 Tax=Acetobacter sp. TaxID=440 RepID=UPI0039E74643